MSVFDVPRLHFAGRAVTRLPTGPRAGLVDLARNQAVLDGRPFPVERPPHEYHEKLAQLGLQGWNFGGNGHFWTDAEVVGWEQQPGVVRTQDAVIGRKVDMWGHYNDYLGSTFNRARVFDVDPASRWTTTLMVGRFCFGRLGRSHDNGYMAVGDVHGCQPPRWQTERHILDTGERPLEREFRRAAVHQFVVEDGHGLQWLAGAADSAAVSALRRRVTDDDSVGGLVVRFALTNMATPTAPDTPDWWDLRGTIAPWLPGEVRSAPAGRLLTARRATPEAPSPLNAMSVRITPEHTTADLVVALPVESRSPQPGPGPTHRLGPPLDVGDLELRTRATGRPVARIPREAYRSAGHHRTGGILTVPTHPGWAEEPDEALCLVGRPGGGPPAVLLTEEETVVQADEASLFLEHPHRAAGEDHAVRVPVRSFVRGRPAAVQGIRVRQFFNPRALPLDPRAGAEGARSDDLAIVEVTGDDGADYATGCTLDTDRHGHGALTVRGAEPGATRVLLLPPGVQPPCDPAAPGSAAEAHGERAAQWSALGELSVRVLPDDWHLDAIPQQEVTFDLLYREVFAYYELLYSFMKDEVFSLADECKVATYARVIWLMCDPANKDRTFYMPPTRDMSGPKSRLLLKYLRADEASRRTPPRLVPRKPREGMITTRERLYYALREAATLELAVMQQYLYAAWSIPLYEAGREYVSRGEWTPEQLRLACGDGAQTLANGIRGTLLSVAREEMIHFLVINNVIMAMGQPFHFPAVDYGDINSRLLVPMDLCLEGFGLGSVQRFIAVEQPHALGGEFAPGPPDAVRPRRGPLFPYDSLSDLYAAIKDGIRRVPDAFLVEPGSGGGEHHLFMRESVNSVHPDYQLEVDDVNSALFAIDFVTEHGEGGALASVSPPEDSHFATFVKISDVLMRHHVRSCGGESGPRVPWTPAYPVLRNPTLADGDPARDPVTATEARSAMELFNHSYFLMRQLMVQHFGAGPAASLRRSKLMNAAIDVMTGMMRPIAEHIVTLPSGRPGRTAGPSFELAATPDFIPRPDAALRSMGLRFARLAAAAGKQPGLPPRVAELMRFYADHCRDGL